jgi:hypothetical protein
MKENMKAIIFLIADYINIRHRRYKSQMKTEIYIKQLNLALKMKNQPLM